MVFALFLYPSVRIFTDAPDYGVFLNGADLVNQGFVPSRDFVEPQGPGSFLWLALFFRVFGTTFETARALLLVTGVATGLLIFYLARRLGGTGLFPAAFVVATAIPVLPINSPHYDSNLFALGAFAAFVADPLPRARTMATSALLCGITTWMIQQKGYYLALALLASLLFSRGGKAWREALIFSGVFALVALLPFAYFAAMHALPDVWFANYIWPITTYSELNAAPYGFPAWQNLAWSLAQHVHQPLAWVSDVSFAVPFALIGALPIVLPLTARWSLRPWFTLPLLPYWLSAYALWCAELHRLDIGHLRNGVVLMVVIFFTICEVDGNKLLRSVGLILMIFLSMAATLNFRISWQNSMQQQTRRGVIYLKEPQPLVEFLSSHTHAGEEVFVYPYQPSYYFLENLKNPTRYSYLNYHFHTDQQFREATQDLERKKVRYVIIDSQLAGQRLSEMFPAYRHPEKPKLIMEPYLDQHYRLVSDLGRFQVLERLNNAP